MSEDFTPSQWIGSPQQEKLLKIFFKDSPIKIDWDFYGTQKVINNISKSSFNDGRQLVFGPWAGPTKCITVIIHEMGHLAEIDDARMLRPGWGLNMPTIYVPGRYSRNVFQPKTCQASMRELRVIAMAWQLQTFLGIEETPREAISPLKEMPDWYNLPGTNDEDYLFQKDERFSILENKMLEYARGKYTFDFFLKEWKRKNDLLRAALTS